MIHEITRYLPDNVFVEAGASWVPIRRIGIAVGSAVSRGSGINVQIDIRVFRQQTILAPTQELIAQRKGVGAAEVRIKHAAQRPRIDDSEGRARLRGLPGAWFDPAVKSDGNIT